MVKTKRNYQLWYRLVGEHSTKKSANIALKQLRKDFYFQDYSIIPFYDLEAIPLGYTGKLWGLYLAGKRKKKGRKK